MSGETRVDREALADAIHARWESDNRAQSMRGYALAAADAVLALFPAPHPQGGEEGCTCDGDPATYCAAHGMNQVPPLLAAAPAPTEAGRCGCGTCSGYGPDCTCSPAPTEAGESCPSCGVNLSGAAEAGFVHTCPDTTAAVIHRTCHGQDPQPCCHLAGDE